MSNNIRATGMFHIEHIRDGKVINSFDCPNGVTTVGLTDLLTVGFDNTSGHANWYLGLIDNSIAPVLVVGDEMDDHTGWTEVAETKYAGNRPEWLTDAPSASTVTNSSAAVFTMSDSANVHGVFLCSDDGNPSVTAGVLWATSSFIADLTLVATDVLNVTYTITMQGV